MDQNKSRNRIDRVILGIIIIITIGYIGYFLYQNMESYQEKINIGMSDRAKENPKLAAEMFLKKSGTEAEGVLDFSMLDKLPKTNHAIIFSGDRKSLSQSRTRNLEAWVKKGGNLIITVRSIYDEKKETSGDPFLDRLGVRQYLTENKMTNGDHSKKSSSGKKVVTGLFQDSKGETSSLPNCSETLVSEKLTKLTFRGVKRPLQIHFSTKFAMRDASKNAFASAGSSYGTHLLQYEVGDGIVTVITDDWIWSNPNICKWDHAYLLKLLTSRNKKIWFLYNTKTPGLLTLLITNNQILIISFVILLILLVLKHTGRFGPVIQIDHTHRRQLKEHIDACGNYYWKNNPEKNLIHPLRKEIQRKITLYHLEFNTLSDQQKRDYLSNITKIPTTEIEYILEYSGPLKESEFTKLIKQLKHMMEQL